MIIGWGNTRHEQRPVSMPVAPQETVNLARMSTESSSESESQSSQQSLKSSGKDKQKPKFWPFRKEKKKDSKN